MLWWPTTVAGPWETPSERGRVLGSVALVAVGATATAPATSTLLLNLAMPTTHRPLVRSNPRLSPPRHRSPSIPFQWGGPRLLLLLLLRRHHHDHRRIACPSAVWNLHRRRNRSSVLYWIASFNCPCTSINQCFVAFFWIIQ